jgi:hypothetical protein
MAVVYFVADELFRDHASESEPRAKGRKYALIPDNKGGRQNHGHSSDASWSRLEILKTHRMRTSPHMCSNANTESSAGASAKSPTTRHDNSLPSSVRATPSILVPPQSMPTNISENF